MFAVLYLTITLETTMGKINQLTLAESFMGIFDGIFIFNIIYIFEGF